MVQINLISSLPKTLHSSIRPTHKTQSLGNSMPKISPVYIHLREPSHTFCTVLVIAYPILLVTPVHESLVSSHSSKQTACTCSESPVALTGSLTLSSRKTESSSRPEGFPSQSEVPWHPCVLLLIPPLFLSLFSLPLTSSSVSISSPPFLSHHLFSPFSPPPPLLSLFFLGEVP